jgi:hypothetical protein
VVRRRSGRSGASRTAAAKAFERKVDETRDHFTQFYVYQQQQTTTTLFSKIKKETRVVRSGASRCTQLNGRRFITGAVDDGFYE